ncbi:AfsR/SARP family transcriptional regulator [Streptomyces sp. NPDC020965]|uniref:AfsR/SARP family transcriptional regulator n=1 Tax=Streptomyces sp. NPDC020965 TaxID=3365105 RepID=UPI0037B7FD4B
MSGRGRLELGSDKERIVLASLALEAGRPVALATLIDRLWDDDPPPHARQNVHTYVSRLRRRLRTAGTGPDAPRVTSRAHTYALETDPGCVDWYRFQRLADTPRTDGDDARAVELLTRAEGLWKGEALAGLPGVWAETVRVSLAEKRLGATVARLAALLALGRFAETVAELSALADRRPGDETLLGHLMLAYYGSGRYTDALRVHQRARQLLMAEYGSLPGAELNRIHRGVLDRIPPGALVRGAAAPVSVPRSAQGPPVLAPRNLPHQPSLIGRRSELRTLDAAIDTAAGDGPVVTLEAVSGMAGVGKTAIAVHTAGRLAARFPDGQIYLDLRAHSPTQEPLSPEAALGTLLRLLGAPADQIPAELEGRSALWRTMLAERRAVIVLDDVAGPDQIRPLLPGGSPSLTIITSRRHLGGLPHALSVPLDILPAHDAIALFRGFAGEERTQDIQETARIVRLCGYLPLAIELVANRFRARTSWTLATLAERLARGPGRLAEIRDAESEVARAFDLSYQTLTEPQRTAFRRLGLHPGQDFTAAAAAALLDLEQEATERLLEDLLTCHLLREPVPNRYRYHDLLVEFARALALSEDPAREREQAMLRLTDFYLRTAESADQLAYPRRMRLAPADGPIDGPIDGPATEGRLPSFDADSAKSWFTTEHGNLLAAEEFAYAHGHPDLGARLAYAIAGFLDLECHWQEAGHVLRHAAEHWEASGDESALSRSLTQLSVSQANTGHYPEAAANGERALEIARRTGDAEGEAEALLALGMLNWHLCENRTALVHFQKYFAIKTMSGDVWELSRAHNNLAISLLFLGEHDRAIEHFRKALAGFRETSDRTALAKTLNNVGDLYLRKGNLPSARRSFEESLSILEAMGNRYDRATVRRNLADVLTETSGPASALPLYLETLQEFRALDDKKSQADTLIGMGDAYHRAGENEKAITYHLDALTIADTIGAPHQRVQALRGLGQADLAEGRAATARSYLEAAVVTASRTHNLDEEVKARGVLAEIRRALDSGDSSTADH